MRKQTTQAQRRRIVEVLCAQDGRTPRWLAVEKRRKQRHRRVRQAEFLRLQAGASRGAGRQSRGDAPAPRSDRLGAPPRRAGAIPTSQPRARDRAAPRPALGPPPVTWEEPLVDAAAVAEYLAVDKTTVYRLATSGALPSVSLGPRLLRFRPQEVEAFLAERTRAGAARSGRAERLVSGTSRRSRPAPWNDLAIGRAESVHAKQESSGPGSREARR